MLAQPDRRAERRPEHREHAGPRRELAAQVERHLGQVGLQPRERGLERADADVGGRALPVVAHDDHARGEPEQEEAGQVGLAGLVDDHHVERVRPRLDRGEDLADRHHPRGHGVAGDGDRLAGRGAVAVGEATGAPPHGGHRRAVALQRPHLLGGDPGQARPPRLRRRQPGGDPRELDVEVGEAVRGVLGRGPLRDARRGARERPRPVEARLALGPRLARVRAQQGEHPGRRAFEALAEGVGAPLVAGLVVRRLHREHGVDVGVGVTAAQRLEHRDQLRRLAGQGHAALDALDDLLQLAAGEVGGAGVVDVEAQGGEHLQPRQRVHPRALGRGQGGEQAPDVDRRGEDLADGQAGRAQGEDLLDEHRAVLGAAHGLAERPEALGQPVGDLEDPQVVGDRGGAGDRGRLGALQLDRRQVGLDGLLLLGLEQPLRRAAVGEERREALEHRRCGRGVHPVVDPHLGGPGATVVVEHRVHRAQPVDRTAPQVPGAPGEHRVGDPVRPLRVLAGVLELGERVGHPPADRREVRGRLGRQAPERGHDLARVAAGGVQAPGDGLGEVGDVALRRQLHRGREHLAGAFAAGRGLGGEQRAELGELVGGQRGLGREVGCAGPDGGADDVGQPAVLRAGGEHATGDLGAGAGHAGPEVALHRRLGRALGDQGVQRGVAVGAQTVAALHELGDRAVGLVGVELGAARLETRDARAEPGVAAVGTLGQRDAQVAHLRRQLVAQHPQGLRLLAGHEHAAALGEQRAEQVRDRVGLAGARRPLDDDPRVAAQPAEDPALRRADGQGEERVDDGRLVVPRAGEPGGAVGGLDRLDELGEADRAGGVRCRRGRRRSRRRTCAAPRPRAGGRRSWGRARARCRARSGRSSRRRGRARPAGAGPPTRRGRRRGRGPAARQG